MVLSLRLSCPSTALISSPFKGVFDVASACFSLRAGRVISSGVFDEADVADIDPEVHGNGVALARRRTGRSEPVTEWSEDPLTMAQASRWALRDTNCVEPCHGRVPDEHCGRLRARP